MGFISKIKAFIRSIPAKFMKESAENGLDNELTVFETGKRGNVTVSGNMKNGKKEGLWKYFDATGRLVMEEHYKDGKLDGIFRSYYINGQLFGFGNYSEDKRNGEFLIFKEDGSMKETRMYKNGELIHVHSDDGSHDGQHLGPA